MPPWRTTPHERAPPTPPPPASRLQGRDEVARARVLVLQLVDRLAQPRLAGLRGRGGTGARAQPWPPPSRAPTHLRLGARPQQALHLRLELDDAHPERLRGRVIAARIAGRRRGRRERHGR